jgi:hypothetical protein
MAARPTPPRPSLPAGRGRLDHSDSVIVDLDEHVAVAVHEQLRKLGMDIGPGEFAPLGHGERW